MTTRKALLQQAVHSLASVSDSAYRDAQLLLAEVLGCTTAQLLAFDDEVVSKPQEVQFMAFVKKRAAGCPVAYLLGYKDFWTTRLKVTESVLIPRPETECLIDAILKADEVENRRVLDLGTGSGAIAIALALERPRWTITATDISPSALAVAQANASDQQVSIRFREGAWFEALSSDDSFHWIISNPPYIPDTDPHLPALDRGGEPRSALTAGPEGLDDLETLLREAPKWLRPDGKIALEHGFDQREAVLAIAATHGWQTIALIDDLSGQPRAYIGCQG